MSTIIQRLYEELFSQLLILKTDKEERQLIIDNLLKMIRSLFHDVYKNNNMNF